MSRSSPARSSSSMSAALRDWLGPKPTLDARLDLLSLVQVPVDTPTGPQMRPLTPTPKQLEILQGRDHQGREVKKHLYSGAVQVGKSMLVAMQIFSRLPWIDLAWLVGGRFEDCREEMTILADWLGQIGALGNTVMPKGGDAWEIETQFGPTIRTLSSSKPERLSSKKPDIVAFCEAGQQTPEAYWAGRARTAPRDGLLILAGTQENVQFWYSDLYDRWRLPNQERAMAWTIAAWDNPYLYPGGRTDPKIKAAEEDLPKRIFEARFAGTRPRPTGLVFDECDPEQHVRAIELGESPTGVYGIPTAPHGTIYLPADVPVQPWIDPGTGMSAGASAYAVLAAALWGGKTYLLDEIYVWSLLDQEVIAIAQDRWWWRNVQLQGPRPIGVIDIAGTQHHGSRTNLQNWTKLTGLALIAQRVHLHDAEQRIRRALRVGADGWPDLFIGQACVWLQREMTRLYRYPTDDKGDPISPVPLDRDNHACKALGYGLYATKGPDREDYTRRRPPKRRPTSWGYLDDPHRYGLRVVS